MRRLSCCVLLLALLPWGAAATPTSLPAQSSTVAAVTVKVTPRALQGASWEFEVVFDTHSQELKDELPGSAVLLDARGAELAAFEWKGAPPGGHHRSGILRFKALEPKPKELVLRIRRPGEAGPRVFRWPLT